MATKKAKDVLNEKPDSELTEEELAAKLKDIADQPGLVKADLTPEPPMYKAAVPMKADVSLVSTGEGKYHGKKGNKFTASRTVADNLISLGHAEEITD